MTFDLEELQQFTAAAQKLQAVAKDLMPLLDAIKNLDSKKFVPMPSDRLIRTGEAAAILGVGQDVIGKFVRAKLLTPLYVNSDQRRFWLSEVMNLPREKPWKV